MWRRAGRRRGRPECMCPLGEGLASWNGPIVRNSTQFPHKNEIGSNALTVFFSDCMKPEEQKEAARCEVESKAASTRRGMGVPGSARSTPPAAGPISET